MKSLMFGIVGLVVIFIFSLDGNGATYIQKHSIVMVLGGTFVLLFFATPGAVFPVLKKSFKFLVTSDNQFSDYKDELEALARTRTLSVPSKNELIRYACELWEQGIEANLFISLISQKRMHLENETIDGVQALKNLAKYPPALGMTGTVMGMIALFANLDSQKGNVGANLALAMTATFFGLVITNFVLGPLADRMQVRHVNRKRLYSNIYQILLLINQDEPIQLVTDELENKVAI
ncbi:MAG: MotA/TolQ/ExbB proton channel family protein [Bdellovibrionales bacterium]|nr:MotA/TolQ/ExbB proton channel family protein [Bdellovibrionales bacterium]